MNDPQKVSLLAQMVQDLKSRLEAAQTELDCLKQSCPPYVHIYVGDKKNPELYVCPCGSPTLMHAGSDGSQTYFEWISYKCTACGSILSLLPQHVIKEESIDI